MCSKRPVLFKLTYMQNFCFTNKNFEKSTLTLFSIYFWLANEFTASGVSTDVVSPMNSMGMRLGIRAKKKGYGTHH